MSVPYTEQNGTAVKGYKDLQSPDKAIYFEKQKTVLERGEGLFKPVPLNEFAPDIAKEVIFKNVI